MRPDIIIIRGGGGEPCWDFRSDHKMHLQNNRRTIYVNNARLNESNTYKFRCSFI